MGGASAAIGRGEGVEVVRLAGFDKATVTYARPADYPCNPSLIASTVAWIRASQHDI